MAARPPFGRFRDGTLVSSTYAEGTVAMWDSTGSLVRTFGEGRGEGPGEFGFATDLVVAGDSIVLVFSGLPGWTAFDRGGRVVRQFRVPSISGLTDAKGWGASGFSAIAPSAEGPVLFATEDFAIEPWSIPTGVGSACGVGHATRVRDGKVWSAPMGEYTLRRHDIRSGEIDRVLVREAEWFFAGEGAGGRGSEGPVPDVQFFETVIVEKPSGSP